MSTSTDYKVSCIAFGFTLGFGYLTGWDAWKLTRKHRSPLRSMFIWMVWGELIVNLAIAIVAWLFLEGIIKPTFPTFFFILVLWVFEIQFILQILVNRVSLITRKDSKVEYIRWGTVGIISIIEISVFCIWIPAHLDVSQTYVHINNIWDKITKFIILFVDCGLNYYFITQIRHRLVRNGIEKYNDLVRFNLRIIIVSISMDLLIVGTMFLQNGVVFLQFHPVAYTVKLKIELSMTNLITKIAQETVQSRVGALSHSTSKSHKIGIISSITSGHKRLTTPRAPGNADGEPGDLGMIGLTDRVKGGVQTHVSGDVETGSQEWEEGKGIQMRREVRQEVTYANRQEEREGRASTQGSREFVEGFDEDDQKPLAW
ncbi:uncharacterized protein BDZ99DRAFT_570400 [Mytilinidion resinicola]|uniref:Uncharacterized protein n=1 Tax=Mytilinidion resinicola TaxID=574789 RepID=A0A6A6YQS8_9PEZI|nr:uncharacterized protein BDZ99DRAFT_570400 [Mytilinidion resinicola]KAF2811140.1 hypothetical protein BDZ99DRAFT_570400 [Mytilinidion resinicola]